MLPCPDATASTEEATDLSNPFLQFVHPMLYRELVDLALKRAKTGRLIRPLAINQPSEHPQRPARYLASTPMRSLSARGKEYR
jgi:hypothetical protein